MIRYQEEFFRSAAETFSGPSQNTFFTTTYIISFQTKKIKKVTVVKGGGGGVMTAFNRQHLLGVLNKKFTTVYHWKTKLPATAHN